MRPEQMLFLQLVFFAGFLIVVDRAAREGVLGESTPLIVWAGLGVGMLVMFGATYIIGRRL